MKTLSEIKNRLSQTKLSIFLKRITHIGASKDNQQPLQQKIILSNQIALVMACVAFPYIIIFRSIGNIFQSNLVIIFVTLFLSPLLLNYLKYYNISRFGMIFWGNLSIIYYSCTYGRHAYFQIAFFAIAALPIIIFQINQKKKIIGGISLVLLSLILLELINYSLFYHIAISPMTIRFLNSSLYALTFIILLFALFFFYTSIEKAQKETKKAYERANKSMLYAEKISHQAAFATLTKGIAHEVRNPLTIIQTSAELMIKNHKDMTQLEMFAEMIKNSIDRLLLITDIMLKYGEQVTGNQSEFNINDLVKDLLCFIQKTCKEKNIKLTTNYGSNRKIIGDRNNIYQSILNIVYNSIEAIDRNGEILITLSETIFNNTRGDQKQGIKVEIKDNGCGITTKNISKIFDPFFTTKHNNLGLGLSMANRIISNHDGKIDVHSERNKNTIISIYIPLHPQLMI